MAHGTAMVLDRTLHIGDRLLTIYHWILPFRDSLGEVQGVIGGWIDVSERRQLIEQLQAAKEQADNASRAKSTFLATMSHEIRTPMNAVIGMLELALKRADQGELDRGAIEVAYRSANDLLDLIGDILDIARIETGRLTLSPERANVRQLAESVVRVFDGLARQKRLNLVLDLDSRLNGDVLIDPLRFKQILSNLVSNAIKFTPQGQVRISLQTDDDVDPRQIRLKVTVEDSGIGISAEDRQRLFEPFTQVDNQSQQVRTGAGLGLVISRSLCQMMGGDLKLDSEPGHGTRVSMSLELTRLEPLGEIEPDAPPEPSSEQALRILIVDDHPANRLLLCQQLSFLGHHCETAEQGAQGLERWLAEPFDLVVADCNMPVMNGYDLTRRIREHERGNQRQRCPVWGFTANAQPEEIQRCSEAGMDDCLFKPISLTTLSEQLAKLTPFDHGEPAFSVASVGALTGNRPEMVQRLLAQLLRSSREDLSTLTHADVTDREQLRELAHRIKGAARIIRANRVIATCDDLEAGCATATDATLGTLKAEAERAMKALEAGLSSHQADGEGARRDQE
jgi:two-component system sensor histidine kinase EvgS